MDENINISPVTNSPFNIFSVSGLLSQDDAFEIAEKLPTSIDLYKSECNGKYSIGKTSENYDTVLRGVPKLSAVLDLLQSEEYFEFMLGKLSLPKKTFGGYGLYSKNPALNLISLICGRTLVYVNVQLSLMPLGSHISPHTDAASKLITLCMYFPTRQQAGNSRLGTVFHTFDDLDKYNNFQNSRVESEPEKLGGWLKDAREIYRSNFYPGEVCGFVKNAYSWHSVDKVDTDFRRSVNINYSIYRFNVHALVLTLLRNLKNRFV